MTVESVRGFWEEYRRHKIGLVGLGLLIILVLVAAGFSFYGNEEVIRNWYGDLTYFQDYPRSVPPCWAVSLLSDLEPTPTVIVRADEDPEALAQMLYIEDAGGDGEVKRYRIKAVFPVEGDNVPDDLYFALMLGYEAMEPPVRVEEIRVERPDGSAVVIKPTVIVISLGAAQQRYVVPEIYLERGGEKIYLIRVKADEAEVPEPLARFLKITVEPAPISDVLLGYPQRKLDRAEVNFNMLSITQSIATRAINGLKGVSLIQNQFKLELVEADPLVLEAGLANFSRALFEGYFLENFRAKLTGDESQVLKGNYTVSILLSGKGLRVEFEPLKVVVKGSCFGLLGTDSNGRDLWQGLLYGTRWALIVGLLTSVITVLFGSFYGIAAGYIGGIVDEVMLRFAQIIYSLPVLPLLILLSALIKPSIWVIIILIVAFSWPGIAFVTRSMALQIKSEPYVEAAIASGAGTLRILVLYIFPQVLPYMFASMALSVPSAVIAEASLSFLNLGDPNLVTWGKILYEAQNAQAALSGYWWWVIPPGLAIAVVGMTFIFIGNALDAILNPKLKR